MSEDHRAIQDPQTHLDAAEGATSWGVLAEFDDVETLLSAAEQVRDAGFRRWEAYSPFPVHGLDAAMGHQYTKLPWIVLACGLTGMLSGILLTWYTNATSFEGIPYALRGYLFHISGKPFWSFPAFIPPIFELTILFSAFGAFFGMLAMNRLPMFYHPVLKNLRFRRATQDKFFIGIEAADPAFDSSKTVDLLRSAGATAIEELEP
ncbi:DUF3341 domain-containing protein [Planctomycetales bacterium ZRK34]|nr:DUF3341 domain-containing protein [Planctomycetales bacterium ZRK34]